MTHGDYGNRLLDNFVLLTWQGTVAATADDPRPAALPANVTEVRFARTAAYTRAGRLAAAAYGNKRVAIALTSLTSEQLTGFRPRAKVYRSGLDG